MSACVFFFSLVAAIPTLLVAIFAAFLFQSSNEFWFSDKSRGILENANELARGYYDQNQRDGCRRDTITMAGDVRYYLSRNSITCSRFPRSICLSGRPAGSLAESAIVQQGPDGSLSIAVIAVPDEGDTCKAGGGSGNAPRLQAGEQVVVSASTGTH